MYSRGKTSIEKQTNVDSSLLPNDTIQTIAVYPSKTEFIFAVGSWDGSIRLFEFDQKKDTVSLIKGINLIEPVLDIKWIPRTMNVLAVLGDGSVRLVDF